MVLRGIKKQLVENSIDSFVLSLETINRLSVKYRLESFCMLLCNAWELLMKARIVDTNGRTAIYSPKERGKTLYCRKCGEITYSPKERGKFRKTLSGQKCAEFIFKENDPVRKNLEAVIELRDESVHLVISNVPSDVLELLQSCVLNFHVSLVNWFGISLSDRLPLGMMTFVYDFAPLQRNMNILRRELGAREVKFLSAFQAEIQATSQSLGFSPDFVTQIEHRVIMVNHPGQADVELVQGNDGLPVGLISVARDPSKTHPLRTNKIVTNVKSRTTLERPFNTHCFQSVCHAWNVRKHAEWFYCGKIENSAPQYSQTLEDKIVSEIENNSDFVERCRDKYRASRANS
jgi:hypothetical protein